MNQKLISYLKKYSIVYRIVRRSYRGLISVFGFILGTEFEERRWASKSSSYGSGSTVLNHPHRSFFLSKILNYSKINSFLEIGCGDGPNLYLVSKKFPNSKITGIDINPWSIENGIKWLKHEGVSNIKLSVGKADKLEEFHDDSFDIVFTDAVLMYIGPDKIRKVMKEMIRIAKHGLIFVEWHSFDSENSLGVYERHWRRNYEVLLKEFIPNNNVSIFKLPDGGGFNDELWNKFGALIEVKLVSK